MRKRRNMLVMPPGPPPPPPPHPHSSRAHGLALTASGGSTPIFRQHTTCVYADGCGGHRGTDAETKRGNKFNSKQNCRQTERHTDRPLAVCEAPLWILLCLRLFLLQGCYKGVKELQGCYKGATRVLQGCYKGVTIMSQGYSTCYLDRRCV
jgi:hypothetical protein